MTYFTDRKRTVGIAICDYNNDSYEWGPDWSADFFAVGDLESAGYYNGGVDVLVVQDIDYLLEQAEDWKQGRGDYYEDREEHEDFDPDDRLVKVVEIDSEDVIWNEHEPFSRNAGIYWTEDSFGPELPVNWEEIVAAVNEHFDTVASMSGRTEEEMKDYSDNLWDTGWEDGSIMGIKAIFDVHDIDKAEVIATITGSIKSAKLQIRNGYDNIYTPDEFIEEQRQEYEQAVAEDPDTEEPDFDKMLEDAENGQLRYEGADNGICQGVPFVWLHGC